MTIGSWHLLMLRYFYKWGILDNILIQIFLVLVFLFTLWMSFIYSYANVSSVVDDFSSSRPTLQAQEALKNSTRIAMSHPIVTLKFLLLSILLEIRFFLTTLFVIGLPAFLIRVGMQIGLISSGAVVPVIMVTVGLLLIAAIYINSVIDAFFTVYRYKLYKELETMDE